MPSYWTPGAPWGDNDAAFRQLVDGNPNGVKKRTLFVDGTRVTPGSESCRCTAECEFPCWQRIGIAPACRSCNCPAFAEDGETSNAEKESTNG